MSVLCIVKLSNGTATISYCMRISQSKKQNCCFLETKAMEIILLVFIVMYFNYVTKNLVFYTEWR